MKRKLLFRKGLAFALALCVLLGGCGKGTEGITSDSNVSSGNESAEGGDSGQPEGSEGVMVAERSDSAEEINEAMRIQVMGDSVYTASWIYDHDAGRQTDCKVYRQQGSGGEARLVTGFDEELNTFLVGEDGAIYYLYAQKNGEDDIYSLRKDTPDGATEYCEEIPLDEQGEEEFWQFLSGAVSSQGELCFVSAAGGVYLFAADGAFLGRLEHAWGDGWLGGKAGVVNNGGALYLYELSEDRVALWPINFTEGGIGRKEYLLAENPPLALFSGYGSGLYLSDEESLWNYPPQTNTGAAVLSWNDGNVSLQPEYVEQIGVLEGGNLFLLYWDTFTEKYAQAVLQEKSASEVPEKQTVLLGIRKSGGEKEIKDTVKAFNRRSQDYQVELLVYERHSDFYEDLLKGQGADLFELSGQSIQMLAGKNVLEDLGPYFQQSDVVQEDDLLPCIRNAASVDGKLVCVIPAFYFMVLLTEKGVTGDGSWTVEEFLDLSGTSPESKLTMYDEDPVAVMMNHLCVGIGNYIDWEKRECHFDDPSFASLLETLKANSQKRYTGELYTTEVEKLYYKESLTLMATVGSIAYYVQIKEAFSEFGEIAGYPNLEGEPWYRMYMNQIYGMNSASKCKDGAWAFLEFLLGEESQAMDPSSYFPVVKDALEKQMEEAKKLTADNYLYINFYSDESRKGYPELTQEDREFIRYMAEHARWDNSMEVWDILEILQEELPYYFEGDKSAQDVAKVIQNRVTLYLME